MLTVSKEIRIYPLVSLEKMGEDHQCSKIERI